MEKSNFALSIKNPYFVGAGTVIAFLCVIMVFISVCEFFDYIAPKVNGTIISVYPSKSISHGKIINDARDLRADVDTNGDGIADLVNIKFDISLIRSGENINAKKKSCVVIDRGPGYGGPSIDEIK